MSAAANDLLRAIHTRLGADAALTTLIGADGIRDRLVTGKQLPAIVISEMTTSDYSTATEPGEEHLLVLEVWSDAAGQRIAQEIAAMIHALLQDAALPLAAHALVNLRHASTKARREPKTRLFCAEMRFRAVTE
ncbi:DUF3168 domain-containing protein [Rhizobium tubonense]|uniref:DUF3168 domain-containing protein n=1 Tax=Rhizobium tubonense TaxID=484088 RepID=A0A2W4CWT0_9HYPH|nr:DUF3168 domain-containing protein [Rhizobium tubonense]PZM17087.1 hypothetical protein CPY51_02290 [Rhizobium tubonense]